MSRATILTIVELTRLQNLSPRQNRVTPLGDLIATPARGLVYGNRGCLHDDQGRIRRAFAGKRWLACRLEFRGWRRTPLLQPGRFTELFFLDEATAFAAGHRPCALCRREDYNRFVALWQELHPAPSDRALSDPALSGAGSHGADAIDAQLHQERLAGGAAGRRYHQLRYDELPDGVFVIHDGEPRLVLAGNLLSWSPAGYGAPVPRPRDARATMLTPPSLAAVLRAGWDPAVPLLHPSAENRSAAEARMQQWRPGEEVAG